MKVKSFAPGHITGFFAAYDTPKDPLLRGSVGSGFSVELGARTEIERRRDTNLIAIVDGIQATKKKYPVIHYVISRFKQLKNPALKGLTIRVNHELPLGAGFGMSGAGALSLSLALGSVIEDDVSLSFAYRVAHEADVSCRTGLGDVVSEIYGGFEVRLTPGFYGTVRQLPISGEVYLLSQKEGISTKEILSNRAVKRVITRAGLRCLKEFITRPTLLRFSELSRKFARETGLLTPEITDLLDAVSPYAYAGMVMLGNSVYAFPKPKQKDLCAEVIRNLQKGEKWSVWKTRVSSRGSYCCY